jgi:anti-anti-sigma factor
MASDLQITRREVGKVTVIVLTGALVYEEAAQLRAAVTAAVHADARAFLLDLEQITRLDSSGVGLLVAMFRHVTRHGGHLKLLRPSPTARRVLGISHMTMVFDIFDDENDALLNLGGEEA